MLRIFKYPLNVIDAQTLELPAESRVLSVEVQRGNLVLYALIRDDEPEIVPHRVRIIGTGHPCGDIQGWDFAGTVQLYGGDLVFHVFYSTRRAG